MTKPKAKHSPGPGPFCSTKKAHWIPEFIRKERVKQGLAQAVLGKKLGMPASQVSNYETGHYSLRAIYTLESILEVLGYKLQIQKRTGMNPNDFLKKTARRFPKTVKVSPDLKNSEIKEFFGQGFLFARTSFKDLGYCVLGFKNEHTLTAFCKKFAKHLVSEKDTGA